MDASFLAQSATHSLSHAKKYSTNLVRPDGHWYGELLSNVTITAEYVFLYQCLGLDLSKDAPALRRHFLSEQQQDGSWTLASNLPGDISATVEAYLALRLLGLPQGHDALVRAQQYILSVGGVAKVRIFTRFYLAMFGLFPWDAVPQIPPELILLPSSMPINIYSVASWARSTIIPLSLIRSREAIYPLPNGRRKDNDYLDEIWCDPFNKVVSYNCRNRLGLLGYAFTAADTILYYLGGLRWSPTRPYARQKCVDWILEHQEKQGDWAGIFPPMHLGILALVLEGFKLDHPPIELALEAVERFAWQDSAGGKRIQSCVSPFWDTVLMTIGLCDAGMSTEDEHIKRAIQWIASRQQLGKEGDWRIFRPTITPGGFSFEYFNTWYPDVDDTSAAVIAFLKQDPEWADSPTVRRAVQWILGMQNSDGGWGAFDAENNKLFLNKIPFSDMDALCDPSCADLTGRILEAFGMLLRIKKPTSKHSGKFQSDDEAFLAKVEWSAKRGIEFLVHVQEPSGAWYGRWGSNYIYGTSNVVCGLEYFSHDNIYVSEMLRTGRLWLKSIQNQDGGWGESLLSYTNENHRGKGVSTPSQTSWALLGLMACQELNDEAIRAGVKYLVDTQTDTDEKGGVSWPEKEFTGTGFPGHFYLGYTLYRHYFPLMALGRFCEKERGVQNAEEKGTQYP
jgi:squalene-hopene/tetraprenyl-beta-curcumene cyclase